ncbi:MAG: biopolymer transporter ExbD [Bdellovibrionales bacterium]|jgi:biopolymer transport protein ExbD|nr:biopolymer transporter ExbD [Bdellovibrionales bacterium]
MVSAGGKKDKRDLDFDLNLIPAIDLLSVCISFLLLTAVWVNLGSVKLNQAVGETNAAGGVNPPSLWIEVARTGSLTLSTRDLPNGTRGIEGSVLTASRDGKIDRKKLDQAIEMIQQRIPSVETVIVRPQSRVPYGEVIAVIDSLKAAKVKDVGIAPES